MKNQKKIFSFLLVLSTCISLSACGNSAESESSTENSVSVAETQTQATTETITEAITTEEETTESETEENTTESETQEETTESETQEETTESETQEETTEAETEEQIPHRDGMDGISDKNIDDVNIDFKGNVNNDVTGNWRLAETSDNIKIQEYALSYYNKYFSDDSEIHYLINFSNNQTVCINYWGGFVDATIHEYISGEENDAKELGGGDVIAEYWIYADNGDIQKVK